MRVLSGLVIACALLARGAFAEEEATRRARALFEAVCDVDSDEGPSLTLRVRDFLALDRDLARRTERDAWDRSGHGAHVEAVLSFLHGMARREVGSLIEYGDQTGFDVLANAILWRQSSGAGHSGPPWYPRREGYDDAFGSIAWRKTPRPVAADLLALESGPKVRTWSEPARRELGKALGELCADDDERFAALLEAADAAPADDVLTLALGWTRRPAAVERLTARARQFAESLNGERHSPPIDRPLGILLALRHADPDGLERMLGRFSQERGDRVVAFLGDDALVHRRLAALDVAPPGAARRLALWRLCDLDVPKKVRYLTRLPGGEDTTRLLRALLEAVDGGDPDLRRAALATFEWFQPSCAAGAETALRRLVEDLAAGRIESRSRCVGLWEETIPSLRVRHGFTIAHGNMPGAGMGSLYDQPNVPIEVCGRWTPQGLLLRLRNLGAAAVAVNESALRHARAYLSGNDFGAQTYGPYLEVDFDTRDGRLVYGDSSLKPLAPQEALEIELPLDPRFRRATHVRVRVLESSVLGHSGTPVVCFDFVQIF